ncbi:hypothetical protein QI362_00610 [Staphylococcus saprophyticus]|nr:hypothetical protein [Staphylococcus saprophyticus]
MKIKNKKQLNLPQLIEWLLKSGYRDYIANSNMGNIVTLSRYGAIQFSLGTFFPEETFTVEVEEEITEDTEFRELVGLRADDSYWKYDNTCIYDFNLEIIKAIYIPNNDLTMTLIWRDGKLVE